MRQINNFIEENYSIAATDIRLLDSHFGTEIYKAYTDKGDFIVKAMPPFMPLSENEGLISEYLSQNGVKTAQLIKNNHGKYVSKNSDMQVTVQRFIKGKSFAVNTAPDWLMTVSSETLGRINNVLSDFPTLSIRFGKEFFKKEAAVRKKQHFERELVDAEKEVQPFYAEQIRHLERISKFEIDTDRLTYANSHGDYHIGQLIADDKDVTVIDWASACRMPVCLELATSYVFASPSCRDGVIDVDGLAAYVSIYTRHFPLLEYDIKAMPYVLYFWHTMCNYAPGEMLNIPDTYVPIAILIRKLLARLYDNVDKLSQTL